MIHYEIQGRRFLLRATAPAAAIRSYYIRSTLVSSFLGRINLGVVTCFIDLSVKPYHAPWMLRRSNHCGPLIRHKHKSHVHERRACISKELEGF